MAASKSNPGLTSPQRELPSPHTEAGRARQALHVLLAVAGWVLFFYWWSIVLRDVDPRQVRFTVLFVGIALVVVVAATVAWVVHNLSIFKRRGARTHVRPVAEDVTEDTLGRPLQFDLDRDAIRAAPMVRVVLDGGRKVYRTSRGAS